MTPLLVTAHLRGPITGAPMLDGLLAYVVAQRRGLVAGFGELERVDIPVSLEPDGRFHFCSSPIVSWDQHELRYVHRRFPIPESQLLAGHKLKRIHIGAGPCKSYRIPTEVRWAEGDSVRWYAIGDGDAIRDLLGSVTHLGKRRAVGRGAVSLWSVQVCEAWDGGFPIVRDGKPMRPLPPDWPGLQDPALAYSTWTYPYYSHVDERLCAVPNNAAP